MIKKRLSRKLKRGASASIGNHRPQQYKCTVCGRLAPDNKLPCVCGLGKQWRDNPADIPAKYIVDPSLILPSGMSRKQAKRVAELREAYQWSMARRGERKQFTDPAVIADYLIPIMAPLHVEHLCVLPLDSRCKLIEAPHPVTRGDVDGVDAGPRAILRAVLLAGAVQFVVAHNHPSGDIAPSPGDKAVTRRLMEGARAIDIPLRDHIIVGPPNNWCSLMRDHPDLFR